MKGFNIIVAGLLILFCLPVLGHTITLDNLEMLSRYEFNTPISVSAHYSVLSSAHYSSELDTYSYNQFNLKMLDNTNPEKLVLNVTKNNLPSISRPKESKLILKNNVWWSKNAPNEIKILNFSKVRGQLNEYRIGKKYRLTLLGEGGWGKVYKLERMNSYAQPTTISAVKLLYNNPKRPLKVLEFRERHQTEIENHFVLNEKQFPIAIKTYGIIKNDADHYLLFTEYGEDSRKAFKNQNIEKTIDQLGDFILQVNEFHKMGYTHGDLKLDNMLMVNNNVLLCDWFSLNEINKKPIKKYRYIGDNLPPEAIRAFYYNKNEALLYSLVSDEGSKQFFLLHPIASDRFCMAVSMLEILAPDIYKKAQTILPKEFNPYEPDSLNFWPAYADFIKETQIELRKRALNSQNEKMKSLFLKISAYMDLNPFNRRDP